MHVPNCIVMGSDAHQSPSHGTHYITKYDRAVQRGAGCPQSHNMNNKNVRLYDFETRQTSEIPAAELAPGMVRANVEGVGEVFIRADKKQFSQANNELPEGFESVAGAVLDILSPRLHWVKSREDWTRGFRGDAHPVAELLLWMWVAAVYHEMTHGGTDPAPVAHDIFNVLVSSMNNGPHALQTVELSRISPSRAKAIVARHQQANSDRDFEEFWSDRIDLETLIRL